MTLFNDFPKTDDEILARISDSDCVLVSWRTKITTVEFIFAQLIYLFKGLGKNRWRNAATELSNKRIGIIGFGALGQIVAKTAIHFGMHVFLFQPHEKI